MSASSTQPLLHLDSELGAFVPADELEEARRGLLVQVLDVPAGGWDLPALLDDRAAFAVMIVDGLVLRELVAEDRTVLQLQGPGDILRDTGTGGRWVVVGPTQIALLDARILVAVHRWPQLAAGLVTRLADQLDRASRQLAIGH